MTNAQLFSTLFLLLPLTVVVIYFDVKYRRIPNQFVFVAFGCGLINNLFWQGWNGLGTGLAGCGLGLGLMLLVHLFGAMGAGDVKLFAAIGCLIGVGLVIKTFLIVVMLGGVLAVVSMIYTGTVQDTMRRVLLIFMGFLPGWKMPRYEVTPDRHTIPYGVAITLGTLLSLIVSYVPEMKWVN